MGVQLLMLGGASLAGDLLLPNVKPPVSKALVLIQLLRFMCVDIPLHFSLVNFSFFRRVGVYYSEGFKNVSKTF